MPRYIESATAAEVISQKHNIPLADLVDTFAEIPAADVAPVVHGRWLNFFNDYGTAECNICGELYEVSSEEKPCSEYFDAFCSFYHCCPNCGAQMDGDKNG